jgi:hypothetical protein
MRKRAAQLPAASIGVLLWQQKVWLLQIEHVLAEKKGPPDLLALEGFSAPALTQYTVTTPDLLHSFRKYNAGKPYHRQVRPFGFMVMFQQTDEGKPSTVMRVIAPFNRNPLRAARKAFDRDTGDTVSLKQLKTYAKSLEHYHNHPEAKFLNGERGDRGPTQRRHVIARSIIHIGKEANKLEAQQTAGIDPHAQIEFLFEAVGPGRLKAVAAAVKRLGAFRIAREAGFSRKHVASVAAGVAIPSNAALSKIERAIATLEIRETNHAVEIARVRAYLVAECRQKGVRQLAKSLKINPSTLSRVVSGQRLLSASLIRKIGPLAPLK